MLEQVWILGIESANLWRGLRPYPLCDDGKELLEEMVKVEEELGAVTVVDREVL